MFVFILSVISLDDSISGKASMIAANETVMMLVRYADGSHLISNSDVLFSTTIFKDILVDFQVFIPKAHVKGFIG